MELKVIGKRLVTEPIMHALTQGEAKVDTFEITLPKMYNVIDLSAFSFKMRGASAKDTIAEQVLVTSVVGDNIILKWTVTSDFTAVDGALSLELVGVNLDGDEIIKLTSSDIYIKGNLIGSYSPPASLIEQALSQMQLLVAQAISEADRASLYVGKSAYEVWLSEGNSGTVAEFLTSLKGTPGADGMGLKILGAYENLTALQTAFPDGSTLNGGFMVLGEYHYWDTITSSWASAGSLQGARGEKGDPGAKGDSGKALITADTTATTVILSLADNTEYQYSTLTSLTAIFPSSAYSSFISFSSGAIATLINFPAGTKFLGCDVLDGVFSPVANKRYSLGLWFDGVNNTVVVGGYE